LIAENKINTLFLSYDGMTDSLGQSQVLPYLIGLSKSGYNITLISFEKKLIFEKNKSDIEQLVKQNNITWKPLNYTKKPPVFSTLYDVYKMRKFVKQEIKNNNIQIIHCRSYITSLIGLWAKNKFGIKFIFDMRGFFADERVDGKIWNINNPIFRKIYQFFKKKEIQFLQKADYTISLTHNAKNEIYSWAIFKQKQPPIKIIPCCVDINLFNKNLISETQVEQLRTELKIEEDDFIISYLGSVGTWYMLDEMMAFFAQLRAKKSNAKFLFINKDEHQHILEVAQKYNVENSIVLRSCNRKEVPHLLSLSTLSIFFILPSYSKKASSPTKQGELMAMQIPVICNSGVGDTDFVVEKYHSGFLVHDFNFEDIIEKLNQDNWQQLFDKQEIRNGAIDYFSLEKGIESYTYVYKKVLG